MFHRRLAHSRPSVPSRLAALALTLAAGVGLDGTGVPASTAVDPFELVDVEAERAFSGLYAQAIWTPAPRWRLELGLRLNRTDEDRKGEVMAGDEEEGGDPGEEGGAASRTDTRGSGVAGVSFRAWSAGRDELWIFADVRDTFKPAVFDFGPEAESDLLEPETATSYEVGVKGRLAGGRLDWQLSGFQMDFENLVLSQSVNGLPRLVNAGSERFRGLELELGVRLRPHLRWRLGASLHDPLFRDYERLFDGVPTQLSGHRLELSAREMASTGLVYAPARGVVGSLVVQYVGERFLNQRNTAVAPSYAAWSAGVGYRFARFEIRLDGTNLSDERPPVSESELGDALIGPDREKSFATQTALVQRSKKV